MGVFLDTLVRVPCLFGKHAGPWQPSPSNPCARARHCQRNGCNGVEHGFVHSLTVPRRDQMVYVDDDTCWVRGVCTQCGALGEAIDQIHLWGEVQRERQDDGSWVGVSTCGHCYLTRVRPLTFAD